MVADLIPTSCILCRKIFNARDIKEHQGDECFGRGLGYINMVFLQQQIERDHEDVREMIKLWSRSKPKKSIWRRIVDRL